MNVNVNLKCKCKEKRMHIMILISFNSYIIRYARTNNLNIYYQKSSINSLDKRIHMTVRFLHLHFKFTFTFTFHPFTTTEYYLLLLLLLLSPHNLFTFLPFYFFTFKSLFTFTWFRTRMKIIWDNSCISHKIAVSLHP